MNKIYKFLSLAVLFSLATTARAHDFEVDSIYYNITSKTNLTVAVTYRGSSSTSYYNEYTGAVTIPKSVTYGYRTYSVTSIGISAFMDCDGLTSITIPSSVTSIGNLAFYDCSGLTSIKVDEANKVYDSREGCNAIIETATNTLVAGCKSTIIPSSVTSIGNLAFGRCSGLNSITIPSSVTTIGSSAFSSCTGLTSITIPSSVTSIGDYTFSSCSGLTSITIPSSVTTIGRYAFDNCIGLISVTIPSSVTSIGVSAFYGCTGLTSITIPGSVTSIGSSAFSYCSGLTSINVDEGNKVYDSRGGCNAIIETATNTLVAGCKSTIIASSVTSIGTAAFSGCYGLTSITIPSSVTSIGNRAFSGCSGLTSVTIPSSVTTIGDDAFGGCRGLTSITIPSSVTNIGTDAFKGCTALKTVSLNSRAVVWTCKVVFGEQVTSYILGENVTTIGSSAFNDCNSLTSITIPSSVTTIGDDAFQSCSIQNVYISDIAAWCGISFGNEYSNPLRFADHLYVGGEEVKELVIPEEVSVIRSYTFYGMKGVSKISVPSSVTAFQNKAFAGTYFYDDSSSRNRYYYLYVDLPDDLTRINANAFGSYVSLIVSPGTNTLLTLWENHLSLSYYIPELSYTATHSTATITIKNCLEGFIYEDSQGHTYKPGESITIVGEYPDSRVMSTPIYVSLGSRTIEIQEPYKVYNSSKKIYETFYRDYEIRTKALNLTSTVGNKTASSMALSGRYGTPDVEVTKETWVFDGKQYEGKDFFMKGLLPNRSYSLEYIVSCHPAGATSDRSYTYSTQVTTDPLTLTTEQPKVISVGNVIVSAQSNLDDAEEKVGFEWRRTDWTDDFASNTGEAYLFEGTMEGYIRNLYAEKL